MDLYKAMKYSTQIFYLFIYFHLFLSNASHPPQPTINKRATYKMMKELLGNIYRLFYTLANFSELIYNALCLYCNMQNKRNKLKTQINSDEQLFSIGNRSHEGKALTMRIYLKIYTFNCGFKIPNPNLTAD